jgi:hypothetical protein
MFFFSWFFLSAVDSFIYLRGAEVDSVAGGITSEGRSSVIVSVRVSSGGFFLDKLSESVSGALLG